MALFFDFKILIKISGFRQSTGGELLKNVISIQLASFKTRKKGTQTNSVQKLIESLQKETRYSFCARNVIWLTQILPHLTMKKIDRAWGTAGQLLVVLSKVKMAACPDTFIKENTTMLIAIVNWHLPM